MSLFLSAIRNPPLGLEVVAARQSEIAGSQAWQTVFISFAVILILLEVIRGWRMGILRQLVRVGAVIAAYATAFFCGSLAAPLLRPLVALPDMVLSALAGAILACLVYATLSALGSILFKRTAQQSSGAVRLVYGLSGAFLGLLFGAFFIWLLLLGIRSLGSIAEAQVQARPATERGDPAPRSACAEQPPAAPRLDPDSLAQLLARLKNSVELGPTGDLIKQTDAMPPGVYQTLTDAGIVLANPETAQRFLNYPGALELSEHPRIIALRNDPEIMQIMREGRLLELLRHPKIIAAANDPDLAERVKRFDLKTALEYATKKNN